MELIAFLGNNDRQGSPIPLGYGKATCLIPTYTTQTMNCKQPQCKAEGRRGDLPFRTYDGSYNNGPMCAPTAAQTSGSHSVRPGLLIDDIMRLHPSHQCMDGTSITARPTTLLTRSGTATHV